MKWYHKAKMMEIFSAVPKGDAFYRQAQKMFGRLNADPMTRIPTQIEMAGWLLNSGRQIEGKSFFEVGTGHRPVAPIGFFLSGAASIITVDLHRRLDWQLTRQVLCWINENHQQVEALYKDIVDSSILCKRLDLIKKYWSVPQKLFKEANINYLAPSDAACTNLLSNSVDYHFSITTLEHIPQPIIRDIFIEAKRILQPNGIAIHFVDPSDHFQHQDKSITKVNFLHFSEEVWMRIAGNEFAYCNRLRASDYLQLFANLSFEPLLIEKEFDKESIQSIKNGFSINPQFQSYEMEDICTTNYKIMLQAP